jgi:hypothetical protein
MAESLTSSVPGTGGTFVNPKTREVLAVVWADNEKQVEAAVDFLRHDLWPFYYLYRVVGVRYLPHTCSCPLRRDEQAVLASTWRERWAWVLVPPGTECEAVVSST